MSDEPTKTEPKPFAYWSGYEPANRNPDGTLIPLTQAELRQEAERFRHEAERLLNRGEADMAERLRQAADDLQRRAGDRD